MTKSGKHCYYVFKKPSAAEASESVYMRERVKQILVRPSITVGYCGRHRSVWERNRNEESDLVWQKMEYYYSSIEWREKYHNLTQKYTERKSHMNCVPGEPT